MFKTIAMIGLSAALALPSAAALAQQGTSSSYGAVGWEPVIPRYRSPTGTAPGITTIRPGTSLKTPPNICAYMARARFRSSEAAEASPSNCAAELT